MNKIANTIRNRLSLRPPQADSLEILATLADLIPLEKGNDLIAELEKVKALYPICSDFERNFPSICFSLATGVGKTRLMGAFIAYLYLEKGIKNFFVLAPNLTIYNKLIDDFSNINSPKYVFQGIGEFVHTQPRIITGENYDQASQSKLFNSEIHINVFNISKINSETRSGSQPRIKRMAECLGESYFKYLSNLDDLVLLMDESHHYRADRGMEVINELNPILGLELTATPQIERSGGAIKFKNVVFEYSLAKAINDGFVKTPAIATRKDFDPSQYSPEDLDRIKLEDGVRLHEETKVELFNFAKTNQARVVKPFVLVVAKETDHAKKLLEMIQSPDFFEGYYTDKVMEIHSNQRGSEKDENVALLLSLENPDNKIEIVIHVNMLKEGWDVTNLYTIIPLRTAASTTLREQTIGRGLRLPYGKKTGNSAVDKLTVIAHDKFQEIIDEANKPDSIIKRENIIEIDPQDLAERKEAITSLNNLEHKMAEERKRIAAIESPQEKQQAELKLEAKQAILTALPEMNRHVKSVQDLTATETKQIALEKAKQQILSAPQQDLFADDKIKALEDAYDEVVEEYAQTIIEIPRIAITQTNNIRSGFHDFDLDTQSLNYQPGSEEIIVHTLATGQVEVVEPSGRRVRYDRLENILVNELINYSEIDYDAHTELLFKLAQQAVKKFQSYLNEEQALNVIQGRKREIGQYIYTQLMEHFFVEAPEFEKPLVLPFVRIEQHNYSKYTKDSIFDFRQTIEPAGQIPKKVFTGFKKACHKLYKFDTKTEKDFAIILESDNETSVLKWLRPAQKQFTIYWDHNSRQYEPDFVVETREAIYLVETKKQADMASSEVQQKAQAALEYCKHANDFTSQNGGKPWKYILIPHNAVLFNMSFEHLMTKYEVQCTDNFRLRNMDGIPA